MNEILMRLAAESLVFLELTGDELIDPDIAVRQGPWPHGLIRLAADVAHLHLRHVNGLC